MTVDSAIAFGLGFGTCLLLASLLFGRLDRISHRECCEHDGHVESLDFPEECKWCGDDRRGPRRAA